MYKAMSDRSPEGVRLEENPHKLIVKVRADHHMDGTITPLMFRSAHSEETAYIDRVVDVRRAASTKAGGTGIRYTCMVRGQRVYLFNDRDIWFVEVE